MNSEVQIHRSPDSLLESTEQSKLNLKRRRKFTDRLVHSSNRLQNSPPHLSSSNLQPQASHLRPKYLSKNTDKILPVL